MKPNKPTRKAAESIIIGVLVVSLIFIAAVEGVFNPFWLWNALPVVVSLGLLLRFVRRYESSGVPLVAGAAAFALVAVGIVLAFHFAWAFDIAQTATGSSTSGIAFVFIPIWALLGGGGAFLVVSIVALGFHLLFARHR